MAAGEPLHVLSFDGQRELVQAARAHELLEAFEQTLQLPATQCAFSAITLRNKSYTLEAAQVIAQFLTKLFEANAFERLTSVDFADIIAGRPEDEALQVLATLCDALQGVKTLTSIDLSDNALGEKGVRACFGLLLQQERLQHVFFCNNGISAAAAGVIADEVLLYRGMDVPTELETFHFYNNMSGDGGAVALARLLPRCPKLKDLRFSATRAQREGSLAFARGMASLRLLEKVDLSDNTFGAEGGVAIAAALKEQANLQQVNLRDATIEDDGMIAIAKALPTDVTTLDVSGNELTSDGIDALATALKNLPTLSVLQAEENEFGTEGAKALSKGIKAAVPHLETLVLNTNEIGTTGAVAIVRAVAKKASLKRLELDGNMISAAGIAKITDVLSTVKKQDVLGSLEDNDEDGGDDEDVEDEEEEDADVSSNSVDELSAKLEQVALDEPATASFVFASAQREVVNAARARELLQQANINPDERSPLHFASVSLRGKSYTEDGAHVLADGLLARLVGLQTVDLADVIAGRPEDEALRVLTCFAEALRGHTLDSIDLSDNALGEKGIRASIALVVPQPKLRHLLLCNNGLSAAAAKLIADELILQNGAEAISPLEEFQFYNNMSGHDGALAIASVLKQCTNLRAFRYASARAGSKGCEELAKQIGLHLHHLESLDLSDGSFQDGGVEALSDAVAKQPDLKILKLRDASLGEDGATQVLQALNKSHILLHSLDFSGNELEDDGLEAIAPLLEKQTLLQVLRLEDNELSSTGVKRLASILSSLPALEELWLNGNEITAAGALAIVEAITSHVPKIVKLELDANQISSQGVVKIRAILDKFGKLNVLGSLDDNESDDEDDE